MTSRTAGQRGAEYTILILIALFVPWMTYVGANLLLDSERYVEKQKQVDDLHQQLHVLDGMLLTLQEAETGQRGYLLTGRAEYLHPYVRARDTIDALLAALLQAFGNDRDLQDRYWEIESLARRKLEILDRSVHLAKTKGRAAATAAMRDGSDRATMRELRSTINGIRVRKTAALNMEFQDAANRQRSTRTNALLLFVSLIGFAGLTLSVALRGLRFKRKLAEQLRKDSHHDALTMLPNRRYLEEILRQTIARAERNRSGFALLYIDLDGFKQINDRFGHPAGDELLKSVAARFRSVVREGEMVGRLGGDEFAVVMSALQNPDEPQLLATRLVESLQGVLLPDFPEARVSASVGTAFYPEAGRTAEQILRHADERMYAAKRNGSASLIQAA